MQAFSINGTIPWKDGVVIFLSIELKAFLAGEACSVRLRGADTSTAENGGSM